MKLLFFIIIFCISLVIGLKNGKCNKHDKKLFLRDGKTYPSLFRSLGGFGVEKEEFQSKVSQASGLSMECSSCYAESYICGYENCKWKCAWEGGRCNTCLEDAGCIEFCKKCTGF